MKRNWLATGLLLSLIFLGVPLAVLAYVSRQDGLTWSQTLQRAFSRPNEDQAESNKNDPATSPRKGATDFLQSLSIGKPHERPRITNLQAVDLDQDGLLDVVVADARTDQVTWIRQYPRGAFKEQVCAEEVIVPGHVVAADIDDDGDLDLLVAVLGLITPTNDKVGSVVVLENRGDMTFTKRVIVDELGRVADVRAGDIDGDGDLDLVAAEFGQDEGKTLWLENQGSWTFKSHTLQPLSGSIHNELADIDKDGDLDIVALISQEWEEITVLLNDGHGKFSPSLIYGSSNEDFGSSGITLSDFDQDGDLDVIYTNGDCFDYVPPRTRRWHGVQWLENQGDLKFKFHRIADYRGAYRALPADVDHDGDLDLFVSNGFSLSMSSDPQSLIWLENDGQMNFRRHDLADSPSNLVTLDMGDFNGNGETDLVTGGLYIYPPYERTGRVTLWVNQGTTDGKDTSSKVRTVPQP